ncbi:MAG: flavin prenyltransferase UbiX [Mariprofundaceae bacterium]
MSDRDHALRADEVIVAVTGASGACYALRLIERLAGAGRRLHLLISDAGRIVLEHEAGLLLPDAPDAARDRIAEATGADAALLRCQGTLDWFSPAASGSAGIGHMIVVPCSMGTLARIACGASDNLIERAADVMLKERRNLVLVPRETPLSAIHLENMLKLARLGALILPAMPGFYHGAERVDDLVDFMVERMLDHLGGGGPARRWGGDS